MTAISTDFYTHIGIRKDKTEIYLTEKGAKDWETARGAGYGNLLILRDLDGYVSFKGTSDLIEEIVEIDHIKINAIKQMEKEREEEYRKARKNTTRKQKWTEDKLKELPDDEIEYFVDKAKFELKSKIERNLVGETYIQEYAMCLLRKYYLCPFK